MRVALKIAWRFLTSNKVQTALIALGIAIGVSVQIFIGLLITGLQQSLLESTIGSSSQITVKTKETNGLLQNYEQVMKDISGTSSDIIHISPAADAPGFIQDGSTTYPILLRGFDLSAANGIYKLDKALKQGSLPKDNEIILGKELMDKAGLAVGDSVTILTPLGKTQSVTISGVYDLKVASLNESWAIGTLALTQQIFDYKTAVTSIEMQVNSVFSADTIANSIQNILPSDLTVTNWKVQNASLLSGLNGQSISSLMIQVFVLVSVVLGIASVLAISVLQKSRQLGILKAMGIKNRTASLIFLFQGLILGALGAILGILLGLGLSYMFTKFALNPDGTPVVGLTINYWFIAGSGAIALAAAVVASLLPASRSSRLDPMEVIRNG